MSLPAEALRMLAAKGFTLEEAAEFAALMEAATPAERPLSAGAKRTRAWRERKEAASQGGVTVTSPETRHGDVSHVGERAQVDFPLSSSLRSEELPPEKPSVSTPKGGEKRGCRVPDDFNPDLDVAVAMGATLPEAAMEADQFLDYWRSVPGAKGRKLDWPATWRNRCRDVFQRNNLTRKAHERSHRPANTRAAKRGVWADIAAEERRQGAGGLAGAG